MVSNCKPLTQEQSDEIVKWMESDFAFFRDFLPQKFREKFPVACCDSCSNGEHCESEVIREENETSESYMERLKKAGKTMEKNIPRILLLWEDSEGKHHLEDASQAIPTIVEDMQKDLETYCNVTIKLA